MICDIEINENGLNVSACQKFIGHTTYRFCLS